MTTLAEIKSKVENRNYACQAAEQHLKFLLGKVEGHEELLNEVLENLKTTEESFGAHPLAEKIRVALGMPELLTEEGKKLRRELTAGKE